MEHLDSRIVTSQIRFIALINGFIGFGALYGVAGMVALFGGADVVTSGFSAGEPYPPRLHVKPPSNKLSMLYHHTKVRIPPNQQGSVIFYPSVQLPIFKTSSIGLFVTLVNE